MSISQILEKFYKNQIEIIKSKKNYVSYVYKVRQIRFLILDVAYIVKKEDIKKYSYNSYFGMFRSCRYINDT